MEQRKWEELNHDCLMKIFERVGMKALIDGVPFVCKSWYKATLVPDCWKFLDLQVLPKHIFPLPVEENISNFPYMLIQLDKKPLEFIKFVVDRSGGAALLVSLPNENCPIEALEYIAKGCPALKFLKIHRGSMQRHYHNIPELIPKWKHLEILVLGLADCYFSFQEILSQINIHCNNFTGLTALGSIHLEEASAITSLIPKIKHLRLTKSYVSHDSLKLILSVCKDLELLDVRDCIGFEENDAEILLMASYIKNFDSKGAKLYDDFDDFDNFGLSSRDVDFGGNDSD